MARKYTEAKRNLVNEIRRLKRNITRRLENIHDRYSDTDIGFQIYERYKRQLDNVFYKTEIKNAQEIRTKIDINPDTTIEDLKLIRKNISRLEGKRSTYVKDFEMYNNIIEKCIDNGISQDWAFELYDKLVEEGLLLANYKYEIVSKIVDYAIDGMDDNEIALRVRDIYNNMNGGKSFNEALKDYESSYEKFFDYTSLR